MIAIYYDKDRDEDEGKYFLRLVDYCEDFKPMAMPDTRFINAFGYWCDREHLERTIESMREQMDAIVARENTCPECGRVRE